MKRNILFCFVLSFSLFSTLSFGQDSISKVTKKPISKRELRGVFLTSIFNLDWPTNRKASPEVQQVELISILDNLKNNNYNSVFLQVRPECDALYNSSIEPWSFRLTGKQGLAPNPFWDPLEFAVLEAHKRGLDLHAWLNPYRVSVNGNSVFFSENSVVKLHPTWILTASNNLNLKFLNPGLPEVQDYITQIVQDISTRYNIDGIHFDDYFYPNGGMRNQDIQTFYDYNPTEIETINDWRRNSINSMIGKVYDAIQEVNKNQKKNILFGVSPFGIWKSGIPEKTSGNSSFNALFCDPIAWLNDGKVDYLAPQLYWQIKGRQDYKLISKWWNDQIKLAGKQLYASQAVYRMTDIGHWPVSEIQNQINYNRLEIMDATFGQIAYRYSSIKNNDKDINQTLKSSEYQYKAFPNPIAGKDAIVPNPPRNIRIEGLLLKWDTPNPAYDGDLPKKYVVYAFNNPDEVLSKQNDGSKILDIVVGNQIELTQELLNTKFFVVTSLDKNNNETDNFNLKYLQKTE